MNTMSDKNLSGLRGIFCLAIVLFHYSDAPTIYFYPFLAPFSSLRHFIFIQHADKLVYFFFGLTGHLLTGKYLKDGYSLREFLKKRILRIFPLHLFILSLWFLVIFFYHQFAGQFRIGSLWLNALLIQNWIPEHWRDWNYPSWSLSSEWFLYLVFGFILFINNKLRWGRTRFGFGIGIILLSTFLLPKMTQVNGFNLRIISEESRFFLFGVLVTVSDVARYLKNNICRTLVQIFSFILVWFFIQDREFLQWLIPVFSLLIISFRQSETILSSFIRNPIFAWLGERSLSMYLGHILVLEFLRPFFTILNHGLLLTLSLLILLTFTEVLYFIFEKKLYRSFGR